ncbi:hypothetical protein BH11MYX3_BH11MYX3_30690 [soil metagenome]
MRLVVGLFAMFLTASVARADEAKAPDPKPESTRTKVGLRVVKLLPESHQALLFDKIRGTHVLAEVGGTVDGYRVVDIDEDEVTLSAENGREIILAAPAAEPSPRPQPARRAVARTAPAATGTAPQDPYAAAPAADAPVDPYAEAPVRTVAAPSPAGDPYAEVPAAPSTNTNPPAWVASADPTTGEIGDPYAEVTPPPPAAKKPVRTAAPVTGFEPPGTTPATRAPAAPVVAPATALPALPASPEVVDDAPAAPPAPVITPTVLSRSELNVALGDFNKLSGMIRGTFTPNGARLDVVAASSVFAKAGLRPGDIVTAVDNKPLRSIDDAAELYVRASATRAANIQLLRGGQPMTVRVLIQ